MKETRITKKLFGGKINFIIYGENKNIKSIIKSVYSEGIRLQKIFNLYDKNSELSKLNNLRKMNVSKELLEVIKKSLKFSKLTKGSYDISLGKYIILRKSGGILIPKCSYKDIKIRGNIVTLKNSEVILDLGSIAKGYITDKLANFLEDYKIKEFLIDSRGDICTRGKNIHILGVQSPRGEGNILEMKLNNSSVATSGDYMQFDKKFEISHIINQNDLISVTVVSKNLEVADALATAIFTSEEKIRKKIIKNYKNNMIMTINKKFEIKMFNNFNKLIYK